jgi:predicted AlkP superfamily pyrophosphatase or phosphodiesterase
VSLVVVVVVDQMRGDYFDRFGPQLSSGLRFFRDSSIRFTAARQAHALPETAPGHASILSGRYPANTWIFSNSFGVQDQGARVLESPGAPGASPSGFNGSTLVDWIRARDSGARVLSVSRKDRAAILTVVSTRADVYWYYAGRFTTSNYYRDSLPPWLRTFNASLRPADWLGKQWTPLLPDADYPEVDSHAYEGARTRPAAFPHALGADTLRVMQELERFPWMDSLIAAAALRGAQELNLGRRQSTDVLAVSFSTLDAIGHDFGPDSREVHDDVLRLDRYIGWFLDSLWRLAPRERSIVVFTSDHGVNPFPEALRERRMPGGHIDLSDVVRLVRQRLQERYGRPIAVRADNSSILADVDMLRSLRANVDSIARSVATMIERKDGVLRAYTPATLRSARASDTMATLWKRQLPAALGWLAVGVAAPGYVFSTGAQADHGTYHAASAWVPLAFVVPGTVSRTVQRAVESVDIAPTLALLLGLTPAERMDGVPLPEVQAVRR